MPAAYVCKRTLEELSELLIGRLERRVREVDVGHGSHHSAPVQRWTMNRSRRLGSGTQEDPPHVADDLVIGPVRVERTLVRLAQPPRRPVEPLGLPQPLTRGHDAVSRELLR